MTKKELKAKLNNIIDRKTKTYSLYQSENNNNPQVREVMSRIDAELIVFNSVLDALNNNNAMINCY